jgi:hypothetical protein
MRTERYNIYDKVHSSLRTFLLEAGLKIHTTDFGKPEKAKVTFKLIRKVKDSFDRYLEQDTEIFHSVATIAPYIVVILEQVHAKNQALMVAMTEKVEQYENMRTKTTRQNVGSELRNLFLEFTASVLQNINKEENVINEILWSNFTDEQLIAMEKEITGTLASGAAFHIPEEYVGDNPPPGENPMVLKSSRPGFAAKLTQMARHVIPKSRDFKGQFSL